MGVDITLAALAAGNAVASTDRNTDAVHEAYERVLASDVHYRFVIDTSTLGIPRQHTRRREVADPAEEVVHQGAGRNVHR
jgi:hypothetical protein